jgi:hydrogenase expression/formation protein HypE
MTNTLPAFEGPVCPVPLYHQDQIVMGHGSGGRMTADLIRSVFQPFFSNPALDEGNDFASLPVPSFDPKNGRLIVSVDSHIVKPIFFPGGDIGRLAICGTVNDVAVSGAKPLYITAGFILEEGLKVDTLKKIIKSMKEAADEAGVQIVAGDTKVVEKGGCDQIFITTTGVGWLDANIKIGGQFSVPGDVVIISGPLGDHGIAVLAARGELGIETSVTSDTAPLNGLIDYILQAAPHTHVLRDPTRGGLATTLNEIAVQSNVGISLDEDSIPVNPSTQSACEILGFDPLYIANEGKVIVITPKAEADAAIAAMRKTPYGSQATIIGQVLTSNPGKVMMKTTIGGTRLLDVLAGEMLPRIC